jgi:hypothetical protein
VDSSFYFISQTLGDALKAGHVEEITEYQPPATAQFQVGVAVITPQAKCACGDLKTVHTLLTRHLMGDFGNLGHLDNIVLSDQELGEGILATDDSGKLNKIAILGHYHCVMSEYTIAGHTIWIRTEDVNGSETYTTIMLPSEY